MSKNPGQRFVDAFGTMGGVWYAEGKSYEEAAELHLAEVVRENRELRAELSRNIANVSPQLRQQLESLLSPGMLDQLDGSAVPSIPRREELTRNYGHGLAAFIEGNTIAPATDEVA